MVTFSPAIRPVVFRLIDQLDDGEKGFAAIWRELGHAARAKGYLQPSYESVRRIVKLLRQGRRLASDRAKRAVTLTVEYLSDAREGRGIVLDIVDGGNVVRRRDFYRYRL